MDVRLHLAPLGALAPRLVQVVNHDDARRRNGEDIVPPAERGGAMAFERLRLGPNDGGHRVADQRPQLRKQRADLGRHVALVAGTDVEGFDRVGHAWARDLPEGVDHQMVSFRRWISSGLSISTVSLIDSRFGFTVSARWK